MKKWLSFPAVQIALCAGVYGLVGYYFGRVVVAHLAKENEQTALRFRTWVERNIAFPGRRIRKNLGIHLDHLGPHGKR